MKFSCEKAILQSAVQNALRAVSSKSSIPSLEGILIEAGERLTLTGYDLKTGIRTEVYAEVLRPGSLVIPARFLSELIRKLPDEVITFDAAGETVDITCGMSRFQIIAISSDDFPKLPDVSRLHSVSICQRELKSMISQTIFAVSDNEMRQIQTGSLFEVGENALTIVSVDGYRLALRKHVLLEGGGGDRFSFVVPGAALSEVEKMCGDCDEPVILTEGKQHILFEFGDKILITRRLEGEFHEYRKSIPRENGIILEGATKDLISSIERVSLMISEKFKSPVRCVFGEDEVQFSAKTAIGNAEDTCYLQGMGNGLEIGFNHRFLLDALRAVPAERVRLEFSTEVSPCLILPLLEESEEHDFLFLILPVRLKGEL